MRGVDHLHKLGRVLTQGQILGARLRSPPFYQKLRQHSGFVDNICLSMKKISVNLIQFKLMDQKIMIDQIKLDTSEVI